jgi:hypothetical protein
VIIKTKFTQLTNHNPLEPFVGELQKVEYDLSGPYHYIKNEKLYAEVSIEATIIGSARDMISRYYAGRPYDQSESINNINLRPAEIDDELSYGYSSIQHICPSYHQNYTARLAVNLYLTALLKDIGVPLIRLLGNAGISH